jgi:uncharacterized protein
MPLAAAPVAPSERLEVLDVLRGVALFGILVVNLPLIGLPFSEAMGGPSVWAASTAEAWTAGLVRALFENKFMALFSLLFGMGLALQVDRAEARGVAPRSFYPRRLIALACFGALNATLVFFGDILLPYAVAGTVLYLLRRRSPRAMLWLAAGFLVIGVALSVVFEGVYADDFVDDGGDDSSAALDLALSSGTFVEGSVARGQIYLFWLFFSSIIAFNWRIMALFLVGAAVLRMGWASPAAWSVHRRAAVYGLAIGLTLEGCSLILHGRPELGVWLRVVDVLLHQLGGLALSAGYAGAVALWCAKRRFDTIRRAVARTGRMALTNYLGQNIVAGLIFYGHGLGLAGEFSRPGVFAVGCGIYACQVLVSDRWVAQGWIGPFEWLWRRLTYPRGEARGAASR